MKPPYALLVCWPDGRRQQIDFEPGSTIRLGTGLEGMPVGACDEHNQVIAHVITCGNVQPSWLVCRNTSDDPAVGTMHLESGSIPDDFPSADDFDDKTSPDVETPRSLVQDLREELGELTSQEHQPVPLLSVLALIDTENVSENDARRIHALADLVTALQLLTEACALMGTSDCWTVPGVMRQYVDRARNHLQVIVGNAEFLTETRADRVSLSFKEVLS